MRRNKSRVSEDPHSATCGPHPAVDGLRAAMRGVAQRLTLPLKLGLRRSSGNLPGVGAGSSIDFQDHRPYVPGDDPRHIDWQAYARSEHYTMKMYREEVRPLADLALDASPSMFLDEAKARRTLELAWFCLESALRSGAATRLFVLQGSGIEPQDARAGWQIPDRPAADGPPALARVPWRAGSLRVWLSDLLYPGAPEGFVAQLLGGRGRAIILAPFSRTESDPDWLGNTELRDCESSHRRDLRFHQEDLRAYGAVYRNHFDLWHLEARRHGVPLARLAAEQSFAEALTVEAVPAGAVELC